MRPIRFKKRNGLEIAVNPLQLIAIEEHTRGCKIGSILLNNMEESIGVESVWNETRDAWSDWYEHAVEAWVKKLGER